MCAAGVFCVGAMSLAAKRAGTLFPFVTTCRWRHGSRALQRVARTCNAHKLPQFRGRIAGSLRVELFESC
jgi:hypothetical protein